MSGPDHPGNETLWAGGFFHGRVTFKTFGEIVEAFAGWFFLDPAILERVESGNETLWASGFFHGSVTFKTFGAIVEDCAGGFYLDPATLERVESGIETYRAGGFYHGPATLEASFWSAIVKDSASGFYLDPDTFEGSSQVLKRILLVSDSEGFCWRILPRPCYTGRHLIGNNMHIGKTIGWYATISCYV